MAIFGHFLAMAIPIRSPSFTMLAGQLPSDSMLRKVSSPGLEVTYVPTVQVDLSQAY